MSVPSEGRPRVDLHSHLVPAVDDGARSVDDVLEGVERMVERGVGWIVTTPHLDGSLTREPARLRARLDQMDRAFAEAREAVARAFPDLRFSRANEVALDHPEPDLSHEEIRLEGGRFVLVEWPRLRVPPGSGVALERLRSQGFELLMAHPERYRSADGAAERLGHLARWREAGVYFQVNYGSLVGAYGPEARRRSLELLARGWVHCLASDFHGRPGLRIHFFEARDRLVAGGSEGSPEVEAWELLTRTNPERILHGKEPLEVPEVGRGETLWTRLASLFRV